MIHTGNTVICFWLLCLNQSDNHSTSVTLKTIPVLYTWNMIVCLLYMLFYHTFSQYLRYTYSLLIFHCKVTLIIGNALCKLLLLLLYAVALVVLGKDDDSMKEGLFISAVASFLSCCLFSWYSYLSRQLSEQFSMVMDMTCYCQQTYCKTYCCCTIACMNYPLQI